MTKVVILAGGFGTRIAEESQLRPKPMIDIGGRPILWHIMKLYSHYGLNDFIICLGYKGYMIKEYFANYLLHSSDITIDTRSGETTLHHRAKEEWRVTLVDTGENSMTGGRLRRVRDYLDPGESFCFTYGDGVSDVDITKLIAFHKASGKQATLTSVAPPGRYGALDIQNGEIKRFTEKPRGDNARINGGFFVMEPSVIDRIEGDGTSFEREPLEGLARDGQLMAFEHDGFWQAMDTLRDKNHLEDLWSSGTPPWKLWND